MPQARNVDPGPDGADLGNSFVEHNSPSSGGDLGTSFAAHNADPSGTPAKLRAKHRRKWYWIVGILLLLLVIFLIHQFSGDTTSKKTGGRGQQGPATITVGQATTGNINIYVDALGTVTPTNTVTVYSQITGRVLEVHYSEGEIVHKGDPLVDIDPRPYEATLDQAVGTLQHDQGVLAEARMDLARYQAAFARNAIARQQLEDQEKTVIQDEGTVTTDEGTVAYDKVELAYCHIVAPIGGRVGLRLVDPGNTVFSGSNSTLVVITQLQPITVVFNVSEDDLPQVEAQLKLRKSLEVDAYDRSDVKEIEVGKLSSLDNEIDTTTGTVKFRASFANRNFDLFPNQFVNAHLLVKTLQNATLVPSAAVQQNGTASFVYIVKAGAPSNSGKPSGPGKSSGSGKSGEQAAPSTVSVQGITTLTSNDQVTAVTGVNPGTTLATSGFDRLESGAEVRIAPGKPAAGQTNTASPGAASPGSAGSTGSTTSTGTASTGGNSAP